MRVLIQINAKQKFNCPKTKFVKQNNQEDASKSFYNVLQHRHANSFN